MELLNLDGVIEKGVFEIPSYQRGYAWQERQLKDFWNDLEHVSKLGDKFHYMHSLTLRELENDFVKWFYEHIVLTRIICFEQDSAMQIFQVLNDRGQPLSPIDILKSSLMQEIKQDSEKRKDFITTWDKLVEACKSVEGVDIDLEDFFNMYLEYADPSVSKKRADKELKKVFKDSKKDACEFIYNVSTFMKSYTDLLKKQDRYIYLLRYLPSRYWASILTTALHVKYLDFDALKKLLVSYYYQTWIAGGTITRIKQTSINIIKNVKNNKDIETIQELILDNIESYNTFNQYHYNLWDSSSVYPSKWLRPVLALANYFMADEEKPHFIVMDAETQVEHILPQTPKRGSQWNADFNKEKREEWVNNIANLTLLKRKKNAKALNMDFDEKRKIYGGKDPSKVISCYDITKELYSSYRKWNEKSLQERYDFLYEIITPVLHIEGQEEKYEEKCEDDFDLE